MPLKTATIVRWTRRGTLASLRSSASYLLRADGVRARTRKSGSSIVVLGTEPARTAALLQHLPGVSWIAAGFAAGSVRDAARAAGVLGSRYLKRGDRFVVEAEGSEGSLASDVAGAVTSCILDSVRGARVSRDAPKFRFKAAFDGGSGAVGVELRRGPGGSSMGDEWATVLVSGGAHSSVLAWASLLAGYRVRLVHAASGEEGLRAVARLYTELSHRADPRGLELEVLEGGAVAGSLSKHTAAGSRVFVGSTSGSDRLPRTLRDGVRAPLYLMPEDWFSSEFESLNLKAYERTEPWSSGGTDYSVKSFKGWAPGVSSVLDGLR